MHESEVNRVRREIRQLVLAIKDMRLVYEAAEVLRAGIGVDRVLETGMVVTYCRAYSEDSKRRKPVTSGMVPTGDLAPLHDEAFRLRNQIYAHSDETPNRVVTDPFGDHRYTEGFRPWKPAALDAFAGLARAQEVVFRHELTAREDALRDGGVPPDSSIWA